MKKIKVLKQLTNKFGSAIQHSFLTWKKVNMEYNHNNFNRKL